MVDMRSLTLLLTSLVALTAGVSDKKCRWSSLKKDNPKILKPLEAEDNAECNKGSIYLERDCDLTFRCDPGDGSQTSSGIPWFFNEDPEGDGIRASCSQGQWTFKGKHSNLRALPPCIAGCKALTSDDMNNATYITGPPKDSYYIRRNAYWLVGTIIETKCKPGYTFTNLAFDKRGTDKHECRVDSASVWYDMVSDVANKNYGQPGKCEATCKPFDVSNLPNDIRMVTNPLEDINSYKIIDGEKVLLSGAAYQFQCKDGKNFTNPGYGNKQTIVCKGGENEWYDDVSKSPNARPASCTAPGCPQLTSNNLVSNAYTDYSTQCKNKDGSMEDGCEVTVKCSKTDGTTSGRGYFMDGKPNGHKLSCKNAKWVDETGSEVRPDSSNKYGGQCVAGCAKLNDAQKGKTEVTNQPQNSYRNDDMEFVSVGSKMDTKCKDSYIRPGVSTQPSSTDTYQCTDNGWNNIDSSQSGNKHPANCVGACPVPPDSTGTKYNIKGQVTEKNGVKYLQEGGSAEATCDDKFTQPKGQPSNTQKLTCSGGNSGWMNSGSNKTGQSVLVCVKDGASGCPIVNTQTNPNTVVSTEGNCTPFEGMVPEGCKTVVTCAAGYIPETTTTVTGNGSQILQCKAGHDGYQETTTGQTNISPLKCVAGCELIKEMKTATYSKAPQTSDIIKYGDKEYLRKDAEVTIRCKDGYQFVHNDDHSSRNPDLKYQCKGGDEKYIKPYTGEYNKVPGDGCGGVCPELPTDLPGTEVSVIDKSYGVAFTKEGVKMVVGYEYTVKCRKGYEYPRSSAPAQKGYQKLSCLGGTDGYKDFETNATNAKLVECIPIEEPSCPNLNTSPKTENTEVVVTGGNCTVVGTKVSLGCAINLKCKEGYFRSARGSVAPGSIQPLKCVVNKDGEAEWVGGFDNNPANLLKCTFGCPLVDVSTGKVILWQDTAQVNDGAYRYYSEGSTVSVKCGEGLVGKMQNGYATPKDHIFNYVCKDGIKGKPWKNTDKGGVYEVAPGVSCGKPCGALSDKMPEGVILNQGPAETETGTGKIVTGGSVYIFDCMAGYRVDASDRADNKSQILVCNGDTGKYLDESNNKTTNEPIRCKKIVGEGCSAIFPTTTNVTRKNCSNGFPDKCQVVVQCNEGYIPSDPKYYEKPQQELTCVDGNDWKDANGNKYTSANSLKCVPACKMDENTKNSNSKIVRTVEYITVGGQKYVKEGTVIPTTCEGDTIIWVKDVTETTLEHEFVCRGGESSFQRSSDNQMNVKLGDGCVTTCLPLRVYNMSNTVVKKREPRHNFYKGAYYVATGDTYEFMCAPNYIYPADSKPSVPGVEAIGCDGKTGKYIYMATGQDFVAPTECVRNPQLNDCPILRQDDVSVYTRSTSNCDVVDGHFYKTGCKVENWCKADYKPANSDYYDGDGKQYITCGTGGSGWKDQNGKVITTGLVCEKGCIKPEHTHTGTSKNQTNYNNGNVTVSCSTSAVSSNSTGRDSIYLCPTPPNEVKDNKCTNACMVLAGIPVTVMVDKTREPMILGEANPNYVFGYETYTLKCKEGYIYPPGPYRQSGVQKLTCNPISREYDDLVLNKVNATVQPCDEADGCEQLPAGQNSAQPTEQGSCSKNNGWYTDKCKLTYGCLPGYYPSNTEFLYAGGQVVTCNEQVQKWLGPNGQESTKALDCVRGCAEVEYSEMLNIIDNINVNTILMDVKDSELNVFKCYSIEVQKEIFRIIEYLYDNTKTNAYFCPPPKNSSSIVNRFKEKDEMCVNTCQILEENVNKLPDGVVIVKTPPTLNPYNDQKYTGAGNGYVYGCKDGYEPVAKAHANSPNSRQVLKCQADGSFVDEATGVSSKTPEYIKCKKVEGCALPSSSNTEIKYSPETCGTLTSGKYKIGCTALVTCKANSYPTARELRELANQTIRCVDNPFQTTWQGAQGLPREVLSCTEGCLPKEELIRSSSNSSTSTNIKFSGMIITCSNSSISKEFKDKEDVFKYYCGMAGANSTQAENMIAPCTNTCKVVFDEPQMALSGVDVEWTILVNYAEALKPLIPRGYTATLKCKNGKFEKKLQCDENLKLTEVDTKKEAGSYHGLC